MKRYALVTLTWERDQPDAYMPGNYRVLHVEDYPEREGWRQAVIGGTDDAGWTLQGYVLPRLASGGMYGNEIESSHPVMERVGETVRRDMIASGQVAHEAQADDGPQWNTDELKRDFDVVGFEAPFVVARRRSDGALGSLKFTHQPRVYFGWEPHEPE